MHVRIIDQANFTTPYPFCHYIHIQFNSCFQYDDFKKWWNENTTGSCFSENRSLFVDENNCFNGALYDKKELVQFKLLWTPDGFSTR